jgi:hypothetical protein
MKKEIESTDVIKKAFSKKYIRLISTLIIINIILATIVFLLSPAQVPNNVNNNGFHEFHSKNDVFFVIVGISIFWVIGGYIYIFFIPWEAFWFKRYPNFYKNWVYRSYQRTLNIKLDENNISEAFLKTRLSFVIIGCLIIIISNFVLLAMAFQLPFLYNFSLPFMLGLFILVLYLMREIMIRI